MSHVQPESSADRPEESLLLSERAHTETIFSAAEQAEYAVPWDESPEARFRAAVEVIAPTCTEEQRDALLALAQVDPLPLAAITRIMGDAGVARRIGNAFASTFSKRIATSGFVDRIQFGLSSSGVSDSGLGLRRALQWHSANTQRTDLRVTYPASGADATGFLDHLRDAPIAHLDCVTTGGPQGAERKAIAQGVDAALVPATIQAALEQKKITPADCLVLDTSGFGVLDLADITKEIDQLLTPGGILVVTSGYLGSGSSSLKPILARLPPERYRYVGHHGGTVFVVERKREPASA
ncbi:hypothetical protein HY632_04080 [Candidatus Uhrbacteria bacterium]|nr:hypothetical protein [Candidatus Uhrbacteria bacterium]